MPLKFKDDDGFLALLHGGKLKEARNHLEKKLKKAPNDTLLLIYKSQLLIKSDQYDEARIISKKLCSSVPPITSLELVRRIDENYPGNHKEDVKAAFPALQNLWENAIKAQGGIKTKEVDIAQEWVSTALLHRRWSHVRMAAKIIHDRTTEKKQRKYFLWQIIARYMESKMSMETDARLANMQLKVALKMLSKHSEEAPEKSLLGQEHKLLILILLELSDENLLDMSNHDWLNIKAKLAFLEKLGKWHSIWAFAKETLESSATKACTWKRDDWLLWRTLVDSEDQLWRMNSSIETAELTRSFLIDQVSLNPKSRGGYIAFLTFLANKKRSKNSPVEEAAKRDTLGSDLLSACQGYFKSFASHICCFKDLKDFVAMLDPDDSLSFRAFMIESVGSLNLNKCASVQQQLQWIMAETNLLKFDYMMVFSGYENLLKLRNLWSILQSYVSRCFRLYKMCRTLNIPDTDPQPGDELIHLIFMATINCHRSIRNEMPSVALSVCLLDMLMRASKHSQQSRIYLIEVYHYLGLGSLAVSTYEGLRVRGILTESMAPILFSEFASRCFFSPKLPPKCSDPYELLRKTLSFYEKTSSEVAGFQKDALDQQNYQIIPELDALGQRLAFSSTRQLLIIQARRMLRLRGSPEVDKLLAGAVESSGLVVSSGSRLKNFDLVADLPFSMDRTYYHEQHEIFGLIDRAYCMFSYPPDAINIDELMSVTSRLNVLSEHDHNRELGYFNTLSNIYLAFTLLYHRLGAKDASAKPTADEEKSQDTLISMIQRAAEQICILKDGFAWPIPGSIAIDAARMIDNVILVFEWLKAAHRMATSLVNVNFKGSAISKNAKVKAGLKIILRDVESEHRKIQENISRSSKHFEGVTAKDLHDTYFGNTSGITTEVKELVSEDDRIRLFASILDSIKDAFHGASQIRLKK